MAKLIFRYGAMGSSKTANALIVKYNYEERGQKALLVKPSTDKRDGALILRSRIGLESTAVIMEEVEKLDISEYSCIIVDESQFLTYNQVYTLSEIVDKYKIPVMCFGLRTDFQGKLFEGSKALLELADEITELKTVCWCGNKATFNARIDTNGNVVKEGDQIVLGANDMYIGLCRKHWKAGKTGK